MRIKHKIQVSLVISFLSLTFINSANPQVSRTPKLRQDYQILVNSLNGDTEAVKKLLVEGVDPNTPPGPNDKGMTALMFATWRGHTEIVNLLVKAGANVNAVSDAQMTPLKYAAFKGNAESIKILVAKNADSKIGGGNTPLMTAVKRGDLKAVEALLDGNPSLESKDTAGWTPLMSAARNGHTLIVIRLLNKGAQVNARDTNGVTAMGKAALGNHRAVLQVLKAKGGTL